MGSIGHILVITALLASLLHLSTTFLGERRRRSTWDVHKKLILNRVKHCCHSRRGDIVSRSFDCIKEALPPSHRETRARIGSVETEKEKKKTKKSKRTKQVFLPYTRQEGLRVHKQNGSRARRHHRLWGYKPHRIELVAAAAAAVWSSEQQHQQQQQRQRQQQQ